ncbi:hypothetical protein [Halorubrum sp. FL23]|uniref:hypothetical protein n=1 Tax=Halorubrum sp. FL23 TaxID=3458704 RepID=UPI004034F081
MTDLQQYGPSAIDLAGSQYTVEQTGRDKNFRPEYEARDVTGDTLFRTTYQMYEGKDEFPFVDADGSEICRVKAIDTWDIAGEYLLTDSRTDEELVILDNNLSLLQDTWRLRDAEDESLLAEIRSRGAVITLARKFLPVGQGIAHKYEIIDAEGNSVGSIEGEFALFDFDQYEINLADMSSVPTEPVVIAAIVIDAIQGN